MNQLEFFVASTECERWQVRRCLRAIRVLDERIECTLGALKSIADYRTKHLATSPRVALSERVGTLRGGRAGRKHPRSADDETAEGDAAAEEADMMVLRNKFRFHCAEVTRLAREREDYAKLLEECGESMKRSAATRLLQCQQSVSSEKKTLA